MLPSRSEHVGLTVRRLAVIMACGHYVDRIVVIRLSALRSLREVGRASEVLDDAMLSHVRLAATWEGSFRVTLDRGRDSAATRPNYQMKNAIFNFDVDCCDRNKILRRAMSAKSVGSQPP